MSSHAKNMIEKPKAGTPFESVMREMIRCINELDERMNELETYLAPLRCDVTKCIFGEIR